VASGFRIKGRVGALVAPLVGLLLIPAPAEADVVLDWNTIAVSATTSQGPFPQARLVAMTQLAVFEAVNAVLGEYEPYLGTVVAAPGASAEAAAVAAAHRVLATSLPGMATNFDAAKTVSLAAIPDGQSKDDGISLGIAAADAILATRQNDGAFPPAFYQPQSSAPGEWQMTTVCPILGGVFAHWGQVRPFAIPSAEAFRSTPPPALGSNTYAKDFNEVASVGAADAIRPADRTLVARFYAVTTGTVLWNSAARQAAVAQARPLSHNAWALALLNMAVNDSVVASFETKYFYRLWRPETAIQFADLDGNDKTEAGTFTPLIATPCFPSYPSAHATVGHAASELLTRIYDAAGHAITLTNPLLPGVALPYTNFKKITDDIDDARVYGGIHFRFYQDAGARQGREIAAYIARRWLRRIAPMAA
jgi:hypothetical protein